MQQYLMDESHSEYFPNLVLWDLDGSIPNDDWIDLRSILNAQKYKTLDCISLLY